MLCFEMKRDSRDSDGEQAQIFSVGSFSIGEIIGWELIPEMSSGKLQSRASSHEDIAVQYQVLRNYERATRIDGHYVARGPLADFADKAEPSKFLARAVAYREERERERERERISIRKNLLSILPPCVCHAGNFIKFR